MKAGSGAHFDGRCLACYSCHEIIPLQDDLRNHDVSSGVVDDMRDHIGGSTHHDVLFYGVTWDDYQHGRL